MDADLYLGPQEVEEEIPRGEEGARGLDRDAYAVINFVGELQR